MNRIRWKAQLPGPTSLHRRLVLRQAGRRLAQALRCPRPGPGAARPAAGPTGCAGVPGDGVRGRGWGKTRENHGKNLGLELKNWVDEADEFIFWWIQKHLFGFSNKTSGYETPRIQNMG